MLSIAAANPLKFYWMRYVSERATSVQTKTGAVKISKNDLFGVREIRGSDSDEVILIDGTTFRLAVNKSELLMNRAKEFKGRIPDVSKKKAAAKPVAKKPMTKKALLVAPKKSSPVQVRTVQKTPQDAKFQALLRSEQYTKETLPKMKKASFVRMLSKLPDDATRMAFKRWLLRLIPRGWALYDYIERTDIAAKKTIGIILPKKLKPITTKLTPVQSKGIVRVKLSEVAMPETDDFTDHEIPDEFRRFARVESSGNWLTAIASDSQLTLVSQSTFDDFNQIVKHTLSPAVHDAKRLVEEAIKVAAAKIKSWALSHLTQAKQLGHRTDLFEKLINNPEASARQIANVMLGLKAQETARQQSVKVQESKMDDLLDGLKF